jgi:hypothetical protein
MQSGWVLGIECHSVMDVLFMAGAPSPAHRSNL